VFSADVRCPRRALNPENVIIDAKGYPKLIDFQQVAGLIERPNKGRSEFTGDARPCSSDYPILRIQGLNRGGSECTALLHSLEEVLSVLPCCIPSTLHAKNETLDVEIRQEIEEEGVLDRRRASGARAGLQGQGRQQLQRRVHAQQAEVHAALLCARGDFNMRGRGCWISPFDFRCAA
jgi:hypothetical protein